MRVTHSKHTLVFADSNIWLYAFLTEQSNSKSLTARHLLIGREAALSVQVVNEICRNLMRKGNLGETRIRAVIDSFYTYYRVVDMTQGTLVMASDLRSRYSLSFWDSLIVAAARQSGAAILYSEDMQHGLVVDDRLRIVNPFAQE